VTQFLFELKAYLGWVSSVSHDNTLTFRCRARRASRRAHGAAAARSERAVDDRDGYKDAVRRQRLSLGGDHERARRRNSATPSRSSSSLICWLTAPGVTCSSAAAALKLSSRAAASNACSAPSGGRDVGEVAGRLAAAVGSEPRRAVSAEWSPDRAVVADRSGPRRRPRCCAERRRQVVLSLTLPLSAAEIVKAWHSPHFCEP
jgi:hypothetical protein